MTTGPEEPASGDGVVRCSFCQKNLASCAHLIQSPRANICDECVTLSLEILIEAGVVPRGRRLSWVFR